MAEDITTKFQLSKELDCSPASITHLVKIGLPVRPDGRLARTSTLRFIAENTSGSGAGWQGGNRGKLSLQERAARLLNAGNGRRQIKSRRDFSSLSSSYTEQELSAFRKVLDLILSRRNRVPEILAAIGVRDAALLHCADGVFVSLVLGLAGNEIVHAVYNWDGGDDIPLIPAIDIETLFAKYHLELTPEAVRKADKMAEMYFHEAGL